VIADLLPPAVAAVESIGPEPAQGPGLFPAEEALVRTAGPRRRAEFAAGRACARTASPAGRPGLVISPDDQRSGNDCPHSAFGRGPKMRRSSSAMGTSLMLASRRVM
jgi:4'-phosphopantetheinyl transferase N-terminal domain